MNEKAKELDEIEEVEQTDIESDINDVINRLEAETEDSDDGLQEESTEVQAEAETSEETPVKPEEEQPPEAEPEPQPSSETPRYSAPVDWPKDLEYGELPEKAQEYIHQREVQVNQMLQSTAQERRTAQQFQLRPGRFAGWLFTVARNRCLQHERRTAQQFQQVVEPFRGLMAAEGVQDPLAAVQGLMNTTAQLAMGAPEQKARKIADLIQHYGVDLEVLDKTLAGQVPENPEQARFEQMLNQRLGGIEQRFNQIESQREMARQQSAGQAIQQFAQDPAHEFFPQVRTIMADFLDIATKRGQEMSLDEAYQRACMAHDEVSKTIAQRNMQQNKPAVDQKKRAASSVKTGQPTKPEAPQMDDMDLRQMLENQMPGGDSRI